MAHNPLDLPEDSLASLDEFGNRLFIYPAKVKGFYHKRRTLVQFVLMLIFLVLPWTKINGIQTLLFDLPGRKFTFFGWTFWAHDGPLSFFLLALVALGLALTTAWLGRAWCGWACPQTVFIDGVFRRIEAWVEGNHIQRRRLDQAELSFNKAFKKSFKWFLYTLTSLIIAHSTLAYFVGAESLIQMIQGSPREHWTVFLLVLILSGGLLFNFGWFREQFCIIMCPYGRLQSVLMDEHSLAIMYDEKRGEPRKASHVPQENQGDCISCFKCVAVCPTAIDIRRGVQLECIGCTACADACDEVMQKIKKPPGLIGYSSEARQQGKPHRIFRPRILIYLGLFAALFTGLGFVLHGRQALHLALVRATGTPYQIVKDNTGERVINQFKLKIKNQSLRKETLSLKNRANSQVEIIFPNKGRVLYAGEGIESPLFIKFPTELLDKQGNGHMVLEVTDGAPISVPLVGPAREDPAGP